MGTGGGLRRCEPRHAQDGGLDLVVPLGAVVGAEGDRPVGLQVGVLAATAAAGRSGAGGGRVRGRRGRVRAVGRRLAAADRDHGGGGPADADDQDDDDDQADDERHVALGRLRRRRRIAARLRGWVAGSRSRYPVRRLRRLLPLVTRFGSVRTRRVVAHLGSLRFPCIPCGTTRRCRASAYRSVTVPARRAFCGAGGWSCRGAGRLSSPTAPGRTWAECTGSRCPSRTPPSSRSSRSNRSAHFSGLPVFLTVTEPRYRIRLGAAGGGMLWFPPLRDAPLAQLAEQRTLNPRVRGSSPWRRTRSDLGVLSSGRSPGLLSPGRC